MADATDSEAAISGTSFSIPSIATFNFSATLSRRPSSQTASPVALPTKDTFLEDTSAPLCSLYTRLVVLDSRGDLLVNVSGSGSDGICERVQFQACSRTLARNSKVFDVMLFGNFAESKDNHYRHHQQTLTDSDCSSTPTWQVELPDDAASPMHLLFGIMHGHLHMAERMRDKDSKTIQRVYDLLVVADKYDAVKLFEPWAERWRDTLGSNNNAEDDLWRMTWIYYQLGARPAYEDTVARLILDFPTKNDAGDYIRVAPPVLPPSLQSIVDDHHVRLIGNLLNGVKRVVSRLSGTDDQLGSYCSSTEGGAQMRQDCQHRMLGRFLSDLKKRDICPDLWPPKDTTLAPQRLAKILDAICAPAYTSDGLGGHSRCCLAQAVRTFTSAAKNGPEIGAKPRATTYFTRFTYTSTAAETSFMAAQREMMNLSTI